MTCDEYVLFDVHKNGDIIIHTRQRHMDNYVPSMKHVHRYLIALSIHTKTKNEIECKLFVSLLLYFNI